MIDAQGFPSRTCCRELAKLKPEDLERLLKLLAAMRDDSLPNASEGDR